ncbi:AP-1 complex subunit mu [Pancytospora philotis]|nr:AP-1 complex subunit mu [Pancytospora philotis]
MIHEVFITDACHKVLYGDIAKYPVQPVYPLHTLVGQHLSQLRVNDVVLGVLHSGMDNFAAAKYLHDLRQHIERKILALNKKSVKENYFLLLELLQGGGAIHKPKEGPLLPIPRPDSVYIDVVEVVHAIVDSEGRTLKNSIFGSVIMDRTVDVTAEMALVNHRKRPLAIKTNHALSCTDDGAVVVGACREGPAPFLTYSLSNAGSALIRLKRANNMYTFTCDKKLKFKFLTFRVPVPTTAYATKLQYRSGMAEFNMEQSYVEWRFTDCEFTEESIVIERSVVEPTVDDRPVRVCFSIPEWTESGLRVKKCSPTEAATTKFWITYTTQDGCYELYH